jgi:hypothetical protein
MGVLLVEPKSDSMPTVGAVTGVPPGANSNGDVAPNCDVARGFWSWYGECW